MEIVWQTPANPPEAKDYIFHNGRRYVRPYYFEFISHVKNRWAGKTIVDMFADEFKGRPYEYFVSAVKCGRIQVNGQIVPVSYIVQSSQKISHFLHRHEPPVMAWDVLILHEEPDVLTVCKPASVPVHPCGQYRKNTVVGILQAGHDLAPLFRILFKFNGVNFKNTTSFTCHGVFFLLFCYLICFTLGLFLVICMLISYNFLKDKFVLTAVHRLDRLVSGLLIFARNADKADHFRQQIEAGLLHKEYIAKVIGEFPDGEQIVNVNVDYNAREGRSSVEVPDQSTSKPLKGKTACTRFTRISTNGHHSIVLCEPITGRTHQIRVHLQYTGHPIANDKLYLSNSVTPRSAQGMGADRAAIPGALLFAHQCNPTGGDMHYSEEFDIDPMCTNCPNFAPKGYDGVEEALWLHCLRYSGPGWSYECPYPDWAVLS